MAVFLFRPGAMNSLAGFISTMANIYGVQHGQLSRTSKITIIVTAASTGVLGILTATYSFWLLKRVKSKHDREVGKERAGKHGEGVVDLSKRKVQVWSSSITYFNEGFSVDSGQVWNRKIVEYRLHVRYIPVIEQTAVYTSFAVTLSPQPHRLYCCF